MTSLFDLSHIVKAHPDRIRYWRSKGLIPKGTQVHKYAPIIFSEAEVQEIKKFFKDKNDWRGTWGNLNAHASNHSMTTHWSYWMGLKARSWSNGRHSEAVQLIHGFGEVFTGTESKKWCRTGKFITMTAFTQHGQQVEIGQRQTEMNDE